MKDKIKGEKMPPLVLEAYKDQEANWVLRNERPVTNQDKINDSWTAHNEKRITEDDLIEIPPVVKSKFIDVKVRFDVEGRGTEIDDFTFNIDMVVSFNPSNDPDCTRLVLSNGYDFAVYMHYKEFRNLIKRGK